MENSDATWVREVWNRQLCLEDCASLFLCLLIEFKIYSLIESHTKHFLKTLFENNTGNTKMHHTSSLAFYPVQNFLLII